MTVVCFYPCSLIRYFRCPPNRNIICQSESWNGLQLLVLIIIKIIIIKFLLCSSGSDWCVCEELGNGEVHDASFTVTAFMSDSRQIYSHLACFCLSDLHWQAVSAVKAQFVVSYIFDVCYFWPANLLFTIYNFIVSKVMLNLSLNFKSELKSKCHIFS